MQEFRQKNLRILLTICTVIFFAGNCRNLSLQWLNVECRWRWTTTRSADLELANEDSECESGHPYRMGATCHVKIRGLDGGRD